MREVYTGLVVRVKCYIGLQVPGFHLGYEAPCIRDAPPRPRDWNPTNAAVGEKHSNPCSTCKKYVKSMWKFGQGFPVSVLEWFPVLSIFNCCCSIFGVRNCQCMPFLRHFAAFWPLQHSAARSCHSTEFAGLWFISGWRLYLYVFIGLVYIGSIHSVPLIVVIKLSSCLTHLDRKAAQRRQKHKT